MGTLKRWGFLHCIPLLFAFAGCSSEDSDDNPPPPPPPLPVITNINSSTAPKSPPGVAIEINGSGFLDAPGLVRFIEGGTNTVDVTPDAAGWSNTSIVVEVPNSLSPPVTATVHVVTVHGISNGMDLEVVSVPTFSPSNLTWGTGTAMPGGLRGLGAATIPHNSTHAYLYVTGGQTGGVSPLNHAECYRIGLNVSGASFTMDASWTALPDLPAPRAFHALAVANPGSSPVGLNEAFLFVVGGAALETDAPGGTDTVYRATMSVSDGSIGAWAVTASLPAPRVGHCAMVYRGVLYVIGGFDSAGDPQDTIYLAPIHTDGGLGPFTTSANPLPQGIAFFASFAFGGRLYILGGEGASSIDPNDGTQGGQIGDVTVASITGGVVGTFQYTTSMGKDRKKHVVWNSFGQVIVAEGIYSGAAGSSEMTRNSLQSDGMLGTWNGLTGGNVAGANVFNAASVTSPISPDGGGPRFILLGGDDFAGNAVSTVWVNTGP